MLQFKLLVDQCVVYYQNPGIIKDNGKYVKQAVNDFKTKSSLNFPFDDPTLTYAWPTAKQLGYAVGYLAGSLGSRCQWNTKANSMSSLVSEVSMSTYLIHTGSSLA